MKRCLCSYRSKLLCWTVVDMAALGQDQEGWLLDGQLSRAGYLCQHGGSTGEAQQKLLLSVILAWVISDFDDASYEL